LITRSGPRVCNIITTRRSRVGHVPGPVAHCFGINFLCISHAHPFFFSPTIVLLLLPQATQGRVAQFHFQGGDWIPHVSQSAAGMAAFLSSLYVTVQVASVFQIFIKKTRLSSLHFYLNFLSFFVLYLSFWYIVTFFLLNVFLIVWLVCCSGEWVPHPRVVGGGPHPICVAHFV
jgi:hypothetical protein